MEGHPMAKSSVLAVVLQFNHDDLTKACIDALRLQTASIDVLVVDNGSDKSCISSIAKYLKSPGERLMTTQCPLGYAEAVNRGIWVAREEGYQYVFLAGNDTVAEPTVIADLQEVLAGNKASGAVGSLQVHASDPSVVYSAGARINRRAWFAEHVGSNMRRNYLIAACSAVFEVDMIDFASILIPLEVFEHVGLLNENYGFYWEDFDWCLRARSNGYILLVETKSAVVHHVSGTSSDNPRRKIYYLTRNRLESAMRFRPPWFVVKTALGTMLLLTVCNFRANAVARQAVVDWAFRRPYRY